MREVAARNFNSKPMARFHHMAGPGSSRYARSGWIDAHLIKIQTAFQDADRALDNLRNRLVAEMPAQKMKRLLFRTLGSAIGLQATRLLRLE